MAENEKARLSSSNPPEDPQTEADWRGRFIEAEEERKALGDMLQAIRSGEIDTLVGDHVPVIRLLDNRLVEENARLMKELERSNEDLLQFAGAVAHDFKAPMRHINFHLETLAEHLGGAADEEVDHRIAKVSLCIDKLNALTEGLLKYARIGGGELNYTLFDLRDVLTSICEQMTDAGQDPNFEMQVNIDGPCPLRADKLLIEQALMNILENAYKYRDREKEKCKVAISCQLGDEIEGSDVKDLRIVIEDNGIGFETKYAKDIFTPMKRLVSSREYEGVGIGLGAVAKVVNRHGGVVEAESEPGQGATFRIALPVRGL